MLSSMFPSGRSIVDSSDNGDDEGVAEAQRDDGNVAVQPTINSTSSHSEVNDDEVSSLPLERCMRIVPHDQNTGAFFIAVFHKHSPFPGDFASS